jgi:hypothetical protein
MNTTESNTALVNSIFAGNTAWVVEADTIRKEDRYATYVRSHFIVKHTHTGLRLALSINPYDARGRIVISHVRPRHADGSWVELYDGNHDKIASPSITVAMDKAPEKIATDIQRRLIPDADRIEILANEKVAEYVKYNDGKNSLIRELASMVDVRTVEIRPGELKAVINVFNGQGDFGRIGYGDARINGSDSVDLDLKSLKPELAKKLISVIQEFARK